MEKNHVDFIFGTDGRIDRIEVTSENGKTIRVGQRIDRDDGTYAFRITEGEMESALDAG